MIHTNLWSGLLWDVCTSCKDELHYNFVIMHSQSRLWFNPIWFQKCISPLRLWRESEYGDSTQGCKLQTASQIVATIEGDVTASPHNCEVTHIRTVAPQWNDVVAEMSFRCIFHIKSFLKKFYSAEFSFFEPLFPILTWFQI